MKKKPIPTFVKDIFEYDPLTGIISWKCHKHIKRIGTPAGSIRPKKEGIILQFTHEGEKYAFQGARVAWFLHTNTDPADKCLDHINGNRNDNRFENLRLATHRENTWNRRGVKGYCRNRNSWRVDIRRDGVSLVSGSFKTEEEASAFYKKNIVQLRKEFVPA